MVYPVSPASIQTPEKSFTFLYKLGHEQTRQTWQVTNLTAFQIGNTPLRCCTWCSPLSAMLGRRFRVHLRPRRSSSKKEKYNKIQVLTSYSLCTKNTKRCETFLTLNLNPFSRGEIPNKFSKSQGLAVLLRTKQLISITCRQRCCAQVQAKAFVG